MALSNVHIGKKTQDEDIHDMMINDICNSKCVEALFVVKATRSREQKLPCPFFVDLERKNMYNVRRACPAEILTRE